MTELILTRDPGDRTKFDYLGVGSWRREGGIFSRSVSVATHDGRGWTFRSAGAFTTLREALDAGGTVVGTCRQRRWYSRNSMLTWEGRKYEFVAESTWRTRYAVRSGEQTILTVQGKPGGKHPVVARFDDPNLDAGLLFFASWLVRDIARQQSSAAAGSSG